MRTPVHQGHIGIIPPVSVRVALPGARQKSEGRTFLLASLVLQDKSDRAGAAWNVGNAKKEDLQTVPGGTVQDAGLAHSTIRKSN